MREKARSLRARADQASLRSAVREPCSPARAEERKRGPRASDMRAACRRNNRRTCARQPRICARQQRRNGSADPANLRGGGWL